jgi:hypothetical protein
MTRRQPSEPSDEPPTASDYRRLAYHYWPHAPNLGLGYTVMANVMESAEPIAHQPAGTVGITELLKTQ